MVTSAVVATAIATQIVKFSATAAAHAGAVAMAAAAALAAEAAVASLSGGVVSLLPPVPLEKLLEKYMKKMLIKHPQTKDMDQRFWIEFAR